MNLNSQISEFIKGLPWDYYANDENLSYFNKYTGCQEYLLSDEVIGKTWDWFKDKLTNYGPIGDSDIPASVSILHTNSGLGRIISKSPLNSTIWAYSLCYTCKKISDFNCQKRKEVWFCVPLARKNRGFAKLPYTMIKKKYGKN